MHTKALACSRALPLIPGVRANEYLAKRVEPIRVECTYTAREVDAMDRQEEIEVWEELEKRGEVTTDKPVPLTVGQEFTEEYLTPQRSIFWSQDLRTDDDGQTYGKGMLFLELILLDKLGVDLATNPYPLNETIRFLIRMLWPFLILIVVSKLTRPVDKERLDRFYVKMRTPVVGDRENDDKEMAISLANPSRYEERKLWAGSSWEIYRFNKVDCTGIVWFILGGILILFLVWLISLAGG